MTTHATGKTSKDIVNARLAIVTAARGLPKYAEVAATIRAQIADGTLLPGQPAPSAAQLARATGYAVLTCRRAIGILVKDGDLVPGPSSGARPRVPCPATGPGQHDPASAAHALSAALSGRRRAAGMTQRQFADLIGASVTSVGHAETGRHWHGRDFWERADKELGAGGALLALHDAYREATTQPPVAAAADPPEPPDNPAPLLTDGERRALEQADQLHTLLAGHITAGDDLAEVHTAIRQIQRTVLAQAAARVYRDSGLGPRDAPNQSRQADWSSSN